MKRAKASQRGFTLVELMVSIVAGLMAVMTIYSLANGATRHFQDQQRVSQTQTSLRLAVEQIRADFERAGFGGTPASRAEPRCATPAAEIQAVEFLDEADTALLPFPTVNMVEADGIRLVGNYATSGTYLAVGTNSAGSSLRLQQAWQAFRRDFGVPGDSTYPFDTTTFENVFVAKRILHVESPQGLHFFARISGTSASTYDVTLQDALPVGTACLPGLADGAQVSPLSRIEYRVVNPATAGLTALVSPNPAAAQLGVSSPVLVRREIELTSGTVIPGTTRIVLEYVADFHLEFVVDNAAGPNDAPVLGTVGAPGQAASNMLSAQATSEPERVRSIIVTVAARTASVDPRFPFVAGRASRAVPLSRFAVTSSAATAPAARVRSITTEVFLPNVATRNLR